MEWQSCLVQLPWFFSFLLHTFTSNSLSTFCHSPGTTRGQAGGAEQFIHVEVGLTKLTSEIAKQANLLHVAVVSAQGANKDMWVPSIYIHPMLYIRTLGEKQQAVLDSHFPSTSIFQPGMLNRLVGDRGMENLFVNLLPTLRVDVLAEAMIVDAERKVDRLISPGQQVCQDGAPEEGKGDKGSSSFPPPAAAVPEVAYFEGNGNISRLVER
jgi:hypothetical protein